MIVRQIAVRHGRSVFASSFRNCRRTYASETSNLDPLTTQDRKAPTSIPGHPSDPSSILDTVAQPSTPLARSAAGLLDEVVKENESLRAELTAHLAATHGGKVPAVAQTTSYNVHKLPDAPYESLTAFQQAQKHIEQRKEIGSSPRNIYHPDEIINNPPNPEHLTLPMLLANQTHLGHATSLWNPSNSSYIFGIREGIHIISLETTLAYLRRAAKVVQEVARCGGIILFVGTRKGQQKIVVNAAKRAQGYHIFHRWVPGCLTNGQQILGNGRLKIVNAEDQEITKFRELLENSNPPALRPDLVVCLNPIENEVCLHECGLHTVPTIGVIDTDADPTRVTYPIPANDDSLRSIALIAGALGRAGEEGQRLRREALEDGHLTFDTARVHKYIESLEELSTLDFQERGKEDSSKKDE